MRNRTLSRVLGTGFLLVVCFTARSAELPAFPGAEGWGASAAGGRGGKVLFVTNTRDDGPGSLRAAVETPGPRTILFRVSGVIQLREPFWVGDRRPERGNRMSHVTIAGQSAPGGGITLADMPMMIGGGVSDVVIRHLRFRNSRKGDGISFLKGARRVILDHCSISWATDENIGFLGDNQEVTIQNCINAECLHYGGHPEGPHSKGFLISRGANKVSVLRNFISGNYDRNPQFVGNNVRDRHHFGERFPIFDMRNNVVYNCRHQARIKMGAQLNVINNVFVRGPHQSPVPPVMFVDTMQSSAYVSGNIWDGKPADNPTAHIRDASHGKVLEQPVTAAAATTLPTDQVIDHVLAVAGALPHDEVDRRLIRELVTGKGNLGAKDRTHDSAVPAPAAGKPRSDADKDGMPDAWERAHGLNPKDAADGSLDSNADGYTNLEEYLNSLAVQMQRDARQRYESLLKEYRANE